MDGGTADIFEGLPKRHFGAILADPPWHFKARTAIQSQNPSSRRDVERHYSTLSLAELKALPVRDLAAPHCHLFMWTTGPHFPQALELMAAWGFKWSTVAFTWVKLKRSIDSRQLRVLPTLDSDLHVGLGLTTRKNAEFCLLGRLAKSKRKAKDVREIILSPVREHSRKPDEARDRIERYCDGPYLEMFARSTRPGWTAWGNETSRFDAEAA